MNSTAAVLQPGVKGHKPSRFGLRTKILILAALFAVTLSVTPKAKAVYEEFDWWAWEGKAWTTPAGTCYWSLREHGAVEYYDWWNWQIRSHAQHGYGWGGTPWCDETAARAWAQNSSGTWYSSSWVSVPTGYNANAYLYAYNGYGGVEGEYKAKYGGYWTSSQWSPPLYW